MSSIFCSLHNLYFTNFCKDKICYKLLCPDCIKDHLELHEKKGIKADILSHNKLISQIDDKLKIALDKLIDG